MPDRYRWSEQARQYVNVRTGRFVSRQDVRRAVDATIESVRSRMLELTVDLRGGRLTLGAWQREMAAQLKSLHLAQGAAARGGLAQLTYRDYGRMGPILRQEYRFLARLAGQLQSGAQPLDARFEMRAQMYAEASRKTYEGVLRYGEMEAGMDIEWNEPGANESCDGCLMATAMGEVPIGTLPLPGERDCITRCQCRLRYRSSRGLPESAIG